MHDSPHPKRPSSPQRTLRVAAASLGIVVAVTAAGCSGLVSKSDAWSRGKIDLVESFTTQSPNLEWPYLDAIDLTSQICGSEVDCVQAVGNEYLTLLKFDGAAAAADYTRTLGANAVQIDPLVVHFDGTGLSDMEREDVVHTLSNINASSPD